MKITHLFVSAFGFFVFIFLNAGFAQAGEEYQTEIVTGYSREVEEDSDPGEEDTRSKTYTIQLTQHFAPVNTSGRPLAEAAFLERIGDIQFVYGFSDTDFGANVSLDGPFYGAALTFMQPKQPVVFRALYAKRDREFDPPLTGESVSDLYAFGVGLFIKDGFLLGIEYTRSEGDAHVSGPGGTISSILEAEVYTLAAKFVHELGGGRAVNLEAELSRIERKGETTGVDLSVTRTETTNETVEISGDYYFNPKFSLGAEIGLNRGDDKDDEGKSLALNVTAFVNSYFAVELEYERFFADDKAGEDSGEDAMSWNLGLLARF